MTQYWNCPFPFKSDNRKHVGRENVWVGAKLKKVKKTIRRCGGERGVREWGIDGDSFSKMRRVLSFGSYSLGEVALVTPLSTQLVLVELFCSLAPRRKLGKNHDGESEITALLQQWMQLLICFFACFLFPPQKHFHCILQFGFGRFWMVSITQQLQTARARSYT